MVSLLLAIFSSYLITQELSFGLQCLPPSPRNFADNITTDASKSSQSAAVRQNSRISVKFAFIVFAQYRTVRSIKLKYAVVSLGSPLSILCFAVHCIIDNTVFFLTENEKKCPLKNPKSRLLVYKPRHLFNDCLRSALCLNSRTVFPGLLGSIQASVKTILPRDK